MSDLSPQAIRSRVNALFPAGRSSRGGAFMIGKSIFLIALTAAFWYLSVICGFFALAPFLGVLLAMNGLAVQHDCNHGAMSNSVVLNRILGWMDDVIGGSALLWRHQHNVAHHAHPNDKDLDPDTYGIYPIARFNPEFKRLPHHAWQWLYGPALLYPFIGIKYTLGDMWSVARSAYMHVPLHGLRAIDWALFVSGKFFHYSMFLVLPILLWGWPGFFACFLPLQLVGGFFLAAVFAVSHNVPEILYNPPRAAAAPTKTHSLPREKGDDKTPAAAPPMDWAEMQIRASANWSVGSNFWLLASGGLNYQIEHHLFPGIAHVHYPAISKIIREECALRDIPYLSFPTFRAIFTAHVRHLYALGQA